MLQTKISELENINSKSGSWESSSVESESLESLKKQLEFQNLVLKFKGKDLKSQIKLLESEVSKLEKRQQKEQNIKLENLLVEIIDNTELSTATTEETDKKSALSENIKSILSHSSRKNIAEKALDQNLQSKLNTESVFINSSQQRLSFRLSYHNKVVQTFPQNMEWLVFFGDYLVFLEDPKVSQSKALLSFIDLRYFEKAIGKTALPIFQIPIHYKTAKMSASSFLNPKILTVKEGVKGDSLLQIDNLEISENQMRFLSGLQQLNFNTTVSLLNPANAEITQAYLTEIINNYSASLSDSDFNLNFLTGRVSLDAKQMTFKLLENRREIGSSSNLSGNYGTLNKINSQLNDKSKTTQDFKNSLMQDKAFQAELSKTYQQVSQKRAFWNRYFAFLNHLTAPQPLGSPEITKSLGLIANSVSLKNDTVKNRFETFKEGLHQFLYPKKNRLILSSGVLLGAGAMAPSQVSDKAFFVMSSMSDWGAKFWELISVTGASSFAWVNPDNVYQAYFKGDSFSHFLTGLTALFGVTLATIGIFHFTINAGYLIKDINSESVEEHKNKVRHKLNQFISYMSRNRSDFFQALGNAEKKKLGIDSTIGFSETNTQFLFRTVNNLSHLQLALESNEKPISLTLKVNKENVISIIDFIQKTESSQSDLDSKNEITLQIGESKADFINVDTDIKLQNFFDPKTNKLLSDQISVEIEGKNLNISGVLQNTDFTKSENQRIERILKEVKEENKKRWSTLKNKESFSPKEITNLYQALGELSTGYSSWAKTFSFLGLSWNWFFIGRHIATRPVLLPKILYYSKYFKTSTENHIPSFFNGGRQNSLNRTLNQSKLGFKNVKDFENQITKVEKAILKEVNAQAY